MIFKLNYPDKQTAIADLIDKKIIDVDFNYLKGTHAVVEIGKIVSIPATFDENGELLTEPIYHDGYAYENAKNAEVLAVNGTIFGLSFTNLENTMKIVLLALSILYTTIMIYKILTKKNDENK